MTDERADQRILFVEATLNEIEEFAGRGRAAFDADIAVARACQYSVIRLAADLDRLGEEWLADHPDVPWRLIRGMRNRIAHSYWLVDDDIVWAVVDVHARELHRHLAAEFDAARTRLAEYSGAAARGADGPEAGEAEADDQ
ncbi:MULTISPECIES: HepT-like ribonuclease domain-containing protein [unclassified Nocardia]|uniref:HepT-like ribonuclease domain-containing protein n=1 Tax=Nocardia sp. NPDC056064 TaxID=3345701 RepID=UPI0035D9C473